MAENSDFLSLARLVLILPPTGTVTLFVGRKTMAKLETMTFAVSMMLSSLLVLATLAPIA